MSHLIRSFGHALRGVAHAARRERNFSIEIIAAVAVIAAIILAPFTPLEQAVLLLACGSVLSLELANTALEKAIDIVKPGVHPFARVAKDLMAGAVLISACIAAIVGALVVWGVFLRGGG